MVCKNILYKPFFWFLAVFLISFSCYSQSAKQRQLEQRKNAIIEEIKQINNLLSKSKQEKSSILTQVEDLNLKIRATKSLIRVTNEQANLLNREIKVNENKLIALEEELTLLKQDYGKMMVQTYKSRKHDSKLMFILSSDDFAQAYKRMQYLKQYQAFREKQADSIVAKTDRLKLINEDLDRQKKDKDALVAENKITQKKLLEEREAQQVLVKELKKEEKKYVAQIRKKQADRDKIDRQIDKIIRDAIAKSNKGSGGTVRKASSSFSLTKEAKALGANFKSNKGKLPWPVVKGVKTKGYGKRRHPTLPNVTTFNSGVEISTEKGSDARATFKGKVFNIGAPRAGANKAVYIQHGNYITVYFNLSEVYVKKGESVDTKQSIGRIATNASTGKTVLKFLVYQNTTRLNPEEWIFKM